MNHSPFKNQAEESESAAIGAGSPTGEGDSRSRESSHLRLPWHRFYWSVLDTRDSAHIARSLHTSATRAMLDDRFQAELPLPIEFVATSYAPAGDSAIIACGLEIESLRSEMGAHAALLTLAPDQLPPSLQTRFPEFHADSLNLLIESYEPQPIRNLRTKNRRTLLALIAATLAVTSVGMLLRTWDARKQLTSLESSTKESLAEVTGSRQDFDGALRQLECERDRLASTRTMQATRGLPPDASRALASVLAAWPSGFDIRTQAIAATPQGVTVAAEVNDQSGAETLSQALAAVPDLVLQSPRTHATGKAVRFDASLQVKGATR
ncbi:MAG: hypothetical protein KF805_14230 [Phycisphaeraceae bacterium]|nr:hypothetical protein [Phycisphaeraceae bacterium]